MKVLDGYRHQIYVSPPVLQQCLSYLSEGWAINFTFCDVTEACVKMCCGCVEWVTRCRGRWWSLTFKWSFRRSSFLSCVTVTKTKTSGRPIPSSTFELNTVRCRSAFSLLFCLLSCEVLALIVEICQEKQFKVHFEMFTDVFEEFYSPSNAAQNLLFAAVKKRKEVLPKTMGFVMSVLNTPSLPPRQKAGALQVVGAVAEVLMTVRWISFR